MLGKSRILLFGSLLAAVPPAAVAATFGDDIAFLRKYTEIIVLSDAQGAAQVALAPGWQGRVMTSTAEKDSGRSFGWINRELIASGKVQPHINVFGGEDRLWLGPEGGQFSLFFAKDAPFEVEHWFVPAALDTRPFQLLHQTRTQVELQAQFELTNYAGTHFQVKVNRNVHLLESHVAWDDIGVPRESQVHLVAYESVNTLINVGHNLWKKESGLLSIWILGMFNPSASATIIVPIRPGAESELGRQATSDYFGPIPRERLKVTRTAIFLSGDGKFRSKIGINPRRSLGKLGSYDADDDVLTLVQFDQPLGVSDYVNSLWKHQADPYAGDAANSYNDGPATPGAKPLGPFFELESSSPAASLEPGESLKHTHRTFHLTGPEDQLDRVAQAVLGVSLMQIKTALPSQ